MLDGSVDKLQHCVYKQFLYDIVQLIDIFQVSNLVFQKKNRNLESSDTFCAIIYVYNECLAGLTDLIQKSVHSKYNKITSFIMF